jgi:hypothetical protein
MQPSTACKDCSRWDVGVVLISTVFAESYLEAASTYYAGSLALGGANVFVRSSALCRMTRFVSSPTDERVYFYFCDFTAIPIFCESVFEGGSWALVRRVKQGSTWHPATDDLKGTDVYGTYGTATSDATFSIAFASWITPATEILFITGKSVLSCGFVRAG